MASQADKEVFIERTDGGRLFMRSWHPVGNPRAIIMICHGINSHSGQYFWVANRLACEGYAVYALDLRGRGNSSGERYFVETIDQYVEDLAAAISHAKTQEPELSIFLLGHSAGGIVSCIYVLDNQHEINGFICESFAFQISASTLVLSLIKGLSLIAPHLPVLRLKNADFSRDPAAVHAMNKDPLIANEMQPSQTIAALIRAGDRLRKEFQRITLPVLILHGTADKATLPSGSQRFYDTVGSPDKALWLYQDRAHDLLNDLGKEKILDDISDWIDSRIPEH
ncbi:lysophospholipase [Pseudochelatococcus sp. G4_1912]|uniref:alpha/beta hydrolase n=1 Tax=Pseudochelatococcus sp. G4_1912 TaxID=3114288 RepID=UPI0039C75448